jgi:Rad52/22 family double-strand break repair protein
VLIRIGPGVDAAAGACTNNCKQMEATMTGPNGHAQDTSASAFVALPSTSPMVSPAQFSPEKVKEVVAALEVPFEPSQIEWRVMNTTKNGKPMRGQAVPYADQRAYTDRSNELFTLAGWTRKYTIHTSANFERSKDQKIVAKVMVTCEVIVFGLGSHSATGEEWADDENAVTSAEAQAFKRACACLGLGRYLYYFTGTSVDLDDRKRPKSVPQLAAWATPAGWLDGLRPRCAHKQKPSERATVGNGGNGHGEGANGDVLREIEQMQQVVGKRMYRGLLKNVARVWSPKEIQDQAIQERVLAHIQAAERGLNRAKAARDKAGLGVFAAVLGSLRLSSLDQVANLKTLQQIVVALEAAINAGVR